ncbi:zinc finger protein 184-like [Leptopilina heterotoma]|uniref:zinc finger protein 184-like n=1 Tax=Leptopilina heterotoma TaxID=63436 RepID=UPI001CA8665E|nr:zinc finger protein 184-like [Leptopilina heterotoma]
MGKCDKKSTRLYNERFYKLALPDLSRKYQQRLPSRGPRFCLYSVLQSLQAKISHAKTYGSCPWISTSRILQSILTQRDGNFRQEEVQSWITIKEETQHFIDKIPSQNHGNFRQEEVQTLSTIKDEEQVINEIPSQNQTAEQNLSEKNKSFRCPICNRRFTHKCVLNHHVMYCRYDGNLTWPKTECLNNNPYQGNEEEWAPPNQDPGIPKDSSNYVPSTFTCDLCGKVYTWMYSLKRHQMKCGNKEARYQCSICKNRYYRVDSLKYHQETKHNCYDYENFDFYSDWNFPAGALEPLTEVTTAGEEDCDNCFECSRCNKAYKTLKSLRRHRFHCGRTFDPLVRGFVQNYEENDDQAQFQCVYCNRAYRWKKGLKRHQQRCEIKMAQENQSENNLEVDIIEESNDDNSRGGNPEEPEIDITAEDDEIEIADSPPPSPSTSEQNRKSSSSSSLIVRNRDATIGRFQCILCGKKYGWLKNLRRHQRICRKKTNKHRWKECKVMIEPLPLKSSKRIAEQNFKCSNCFEQFKWLRDLRQHQTNCMKKAQNSWNVSEAKKSSKKQSNLQEKQGGHSSENSNQEDVDQLYKCAFCLKEYKWRRSLRRHYPKCTERGDLSLNVLKE